MITIDQLLESVDLDFEPRFVTKDGDGSIYVWAEKPVQDLDCRDWMNGGYNKAYGLKLSEFDGKDWTECIYEVPRKTTGKIEKIEGYTTDKILAKVNEIIDWINKVDAVNELKTKGE